MTFFKCAHTQPCPPSTAHPFPLECAAMLNIPYVLDGANRLSSSVAAKPRSFPWEHWFPCIHSLLTYLFTLPSTPSINASFRHFASQSIVKMISLFMRNVCQMYLTDASLAYTPCLPTCSTVETSYIHTYLNGYPCHPHPHSHAHTHTYTVELCQYS